MSGTLLVRIAFCVLLGAAAVYVVQQLFPSEERRIRRRLDAIAEDVNDLTTDLSGVATAARLAMYFTEDVAIDPGGGTEPVRGRETILALARNVQLTGETRVAVKDVDITVAPGNTAAAVTLTVTVTRAAGTRRESLDAREIALTMVKYDSAWLISQIAAVDTLR